MKKYEILKSKAYDNISSYKEIAIELNDYLADNPEISHPCPEGGIFLLVRRAQAYSYKATIRKAPAPALVPPFCQLKSLWNHGEFLKQGVVARLA